MTGHRVGLEENGSWLRWLQFYDLNGLPFSEIPEGVARFYDELTLEEVREAARTFLTGDNRARIVLYPEGWTEN